jgi:hypothetical protein
MHNFYFKPLVVLLVLLFGFTGTMPAQYFTYGQDPASQKWRQIRTDNFHLVYPEIWENKAKELAHFLEAIRQPLSSSLNSNPRPIPVVLRNQTMLSNGFVMWAPKRIEMVTTIPHDNQAIDWMRYLTVHEFRHVVQVEAVNQSTTRFFSSVFGQHITGAVVGLHLPLWFLEGDAVLAETSFTRSGRGRLPSFKMPVTAQVLEQGAFSFDKATLGSYRDMVPNHYTMGYHLVAAMQSKYGFEPFQAATRQVARTPFLPGSFSRGVKKVTGKNLRQNYETVITELESEWQESFSNAALSDYELIEPDNKFDYVSYINPQYVDDDTFIAFRTSPADIPRLVKIGRDGTEEILFTPGFGYPGTMSYANGLVAWAEIKRDPRWDYRVWTDVKVFDLERRQSKLITRRGRLQAPRLSPDGSQVAAVEVDETNQWALLIMNSSNGEELHRLTDPEIDFLMEPAWSDDGQSIVAIAFEQGKGKSLVISGIADPGFTKLFEAGFADIFKPFVKNGFVYFTGTWSGRDELYAWDINGQQLYSVLSSSFGATYTGFSDDGSAILFSVFTSYGYKIGEYKISNHREADAQGIQSLNTPLYEQAANQSSILVDTIALPDKRIESQPFVKLHNSGVFHSWVPVSLDVDGLHANPGFTIFSQDLLGSKETAIGFEFGQTNYKRVAFLDYSVKSLYPVFNLRIDVGSEDRIYGSDGRDTSRTAFARLRAGVSLPLSFQRNAVNFGLIPRVSASQEIFDPARPHTYGLRTLSYNFSTYAYQRMAYRDLFPRFGISAAAGFSHSPFITWKRISGLSAGQILYGAAVLYMPGIFRHHSFRLYAGTQRKIRMNTSFGDGIRLARGYHAMRNDKMATISLAYSFPFWYPDIAIGPVLYAKRLKANFFFDRSRVMIDQRQFILGSYGFDLLVDAHLLRMPMPFEFGLRTMYLENENNFRFEFLWGVDFYAVGHLLKTMNIAPRPYF